MFAQETTARRRSRLTGALVALTLTAAVLVVASEGSSIRSARIDPQVPRVATQNVLTAYPDLRTSSHIPKGCYPKFGCRQDATTSPSPDLRTGSHIPKGCFPKFGCRQGATPTANRP